jgi:hypothetical protein
MDGYIAEFLFVFTYVSNPCNTNEDKHLGGMGSNCMKHIYSLFVNLRI